MTKDPSARVRAYVASMITIGWAVPGTVATVDHGWMLRRQWVGLPEPSPYLGDLTGLLGGLGMLLGPPAGLFLTKHFSAAARPVSYLALIPMYVVLVPWSLLGLGLVLYWTNVLGVVPKSVES